MLSQLQDSYDHIPGSIGLWKLASRRTTDPAAAYYHARVELPVGESYIQGAKVITLAAKNNVDQFSMCIITGTNPFTQQHLASFEVDKRMSLFEAMKVLRKKIVEGMDREYQPMPEKHVGTPVSFGSAT